MAASASSALTSEVLRLPASEGEVKFPHKKHQGIYQDCIICHEKGPGKIENLGKEWAHITCKGCHQELKKGPVDCTGCHTV
jgi:hypothetical protein